MYIIRKYLIFFIALILNSFVIIKIKKSIVLSDVIFNEESFTNKFSQVKIYVPLLNDSNFFRNNIKRENYTILKKINEKLFKPYKKLVNIHNYSYILNPEYKICGENNGSDVLLMTFVPISVGRFSNRNLIRRTWANTELNRNMRVVFLIGKSSSEKLNTLIKLEYSIYGDIVQEDFLDDYRNLTYKGIMAMKWISEYCPNVKHILKVDDDIIANIFILLRHLKWLDNYNLFSSKTIMCLVWSKMDVIRDKDNKWYVSKEEFKNDYYEDYCSGSAYLLTNDLPSLMFNASFYTEFFWVDDYYMTGRLALSVNATHKNFNSIFILNVPPSVIVKKFTDKLTSDYTVFGHLPNELNMIYSLWNFIVEKQLSRYPNLFISNEKNVFLVEKNDFSYLRLFEWKKNFSEKYIVI